MSNSSVAIDNTTAKERIRWYRTPLDRATVARLNGRSDWRGWKQTGGYLGLLVATGSLVIYGAGHWPWWVVLLLLFAHGTMFNTMSSAVHELIHRTVFKTRALNDFFARFFSFFSWFSNATFHPSHMLHHIHTLHQPDDLEVVLPQKFIVKHFFKYGFVSPMGVVHAVKNTWRLALGRFSGEWELKCLPEDEPEKRAACVRWGRTQLLGHTLLLLVAAGLGTFVYPGWFLLPLVTTLGSFYGGWLMMLLGTPQHIGMQDEVADYRLCCRTYTTHPFLQFLYWHMNFHIEHHMFAAVPCYNLADLHRTIEHDLPVCPRGLWATWREIMTILRRQSEDPTYQYEQVWAVNRTREENGTDIKEALNCQ